MSDKDIEIINKIDTWMERILFVFLSTAIVGGIWLLVALYETKVGLNHMEIGLPIMLFSTGILGLIWYDDFEKVVRWWLWRKNH